MAASPLPTATLPDRGYEVLQTSGGEPHVIGAGAFGKVLLAQAANTARKVAVKAIALPALKKSERKLVDNEVAILKQVTHTNVIQLLDCFVNPEQHMYLVFEFADGGDLCRLIAKQKLTGKGFPEDRLMGWFAQLCSALQALHRVRILHRDLKAENVLLTAGDLVKLADFGTSLQLAPERKARDVVGTPYYYSPEMCQGLSYDEKTDIWSLGVLLFEMTALSLPFHADTVPEVMKKVIYGDRPPLPRTATDGLAALINELMTKNPSKRPTIDDVLLRPFVAPFVERLPALWAASAAASDDRGEDEGSYEDDFENET